LTVEILKFYKIDSTYFKQVFILQLLAKMLLFLPEYITGDLIHVDKKEQQYQNNNSSINNSKAFTIATTKTLTTSIGMYYKIQRLSLVIIQSSGSQTFWSKYSVCTNTHIQTHPLTHMHKHIRIHPRACVYFNTHTHMRAYTHSHTHPNT